MSTYDTGTYGDFTYGGTSSPPGPSDFGNGSGYGVPISFTRRGISIIPEQTAAYIAKQCTSGIAVNVSAVCPAFDIEYTSPQDDEAFWYSPDRPASSEFLGYIITDVEGLGSTLKRAPVDRETGLGGGTLGKLGSSGRRLKFDVLLFANTCRGMEYGKRYLVNLLAGDDCYEDYGLLSPPNSGCEPEGSFTLTSADSEVEGAIRLVYSLVSGPELDVPSVYGLLTSGTAPDPVCGLSPFHLPPNTTEGFPDAVEGVIPPGTTVEDVWNSIGVAGYPVEAPGDPAVCLLSKFNLRNGGTDAGALWVRVDTGTGTIWAAYAGPGREAEAWQQVALDGEVGDAALIEWYTCPAEDEVIDPDSGVVGLGQGCPLDELQIWTCCPEDEGDLSGVWVIKDVGLVEGPREMDPPIDTRRCAISRMEFVLEAEDPWLYRPTTNAVQYTPPEIEECMDVCDWIWTQIGSCARLSPSGVGEELALLRISSGATPFSGTVTVHDPGASSVSEFGTGVTSYEDVSENLGGLVAQFDIVDLPANRQLYFDGSGQRVYLLNNSGEVIGDGARYLRLVPGVPFKFPSASSRCGDLVVCVYGTHATFDQNASVEFASVHREL